MLVSTTGSYNPQATTGSAPPQTAVVPTHTPAPVPAAQPAAGITSPAQIKDTLERINKAVQSIPSNITFVMDESTGLNIVSVVDSQTKEVIRQMPTQEAVDIARALDKLQGFLLQQKA